MAGLLYQCWKIGNDNAKNGRYLHVLWNGFLWCTGIALFASFSLGNPTCESSNDPDPIYGGCDEYTDDGYEPTTEERAARFAFVLTLLYLPVAIGALQGKE